MVELARVQWTLNFQDISKCGLHIRYVYSSYRWATEHCIKWVSSNVDRFGLKCLRAGGGAECWSFVITPFRNWCDDDPIKNGHF